MRRRAFLATASAGAWLAACDDGDEAPTADAADAAAPGPVADDRTEADRLVFVHGVASGDPLTTAVMLWTRVTPPEPSASVEVTWELASDPAATRVVKTGAATATAERDFCVKVDVTGLAPGSVYYYRFRALGAKSQVARTRTAPDGDVSRLRFGVVSCASLAHGYFHGYRELAQQLDLWAILHLGDYIYEYASGKYGSARDYEPPHEAVTLADYRLRYAQYRRDPDLQALHTLHPMIAIWDDHETADNTWSGGAKNHTEATEGPYAERARAAQRAYSEWLPIRDQADGRIYRAFRYGSLVDLLMLDTRVWGRDKQAGEKDPVVQSDARQLLGAAQEAWLGAQLEASTATWRLIGQQVVLAYLPSLYNDDAWDGYPAARRRFMDLVDKARGGNVIVLTGDIHSSWANEVPHTLDEYDPATGAGAKLVEFVVPAITSPSVGEALAETVQNLFLESKDVRWVDMFPRGYVLLDVTRERVQADWFHYTEVEEQQAAARFGAAWSVESGSPRLSREGGPA